MASVDKDFRVKNGLIVQGTTATVDGNQVLTAASNIEDLANVNTTGVNPGDSLVYDAENEVWIPGAAANETFKTIAVAGEDNIVADNSTDTLTFVAGANVTITTDPEADSITIEAEGGGGYTVSQLPPESPQEGDVWFDSVNGRSLIYYDGYWVESGSSTSFPNVEAPLTYDAETNTVGLDTSALDLSTKADLTGATFTGSISAPSIVPTGNTIPINGMYRGAANQINFSTDSVNRLSIKSNGDVSFLGVSPIELVTSTANAGIEIGRTDGTSSTPYIDFHSGETATDYDVRLIATGGTGTSAQGTLEIRGNLVNRVNTTPKTAAYTLTVADYNTIVQMNGAFAFTVNTTLSTAPVGTQITLLALTTGVSVVASGVTVLATPGLKLRAAGSMATLICLGTNSWVLSGDLLA